MKAIAHFVTGVAIATFFPEVVGRAAGCSILPVLGGVAGILPDVLDFRFVRHLEAYDLEIDPGPDADPRDIAEQVAGAIRKAYARGASQTVMLHTVRLGSDAWRQYRIRFDPHQGQVCARIGSIVNTDRRPLAGSAPTRSSEACAKIHAPLPHSYADEIEIDIFSGPSLTFERQDDLLRVRFLDWHRRWSHSLTVAAALGLLTGRFGALAERLMGRATGTPFWAGAVVGLGLLGHVLQDQLGHMGSNLLYPFTRERTPGLGLIRSSDAVPNFLAVWTATMLILFNVDRFSGQPRFVPWWAFIGLAVILTVIVLGGFHLWRGRDEDRETPQHIRQQEALSDVEGIDIA